MAARNWKIVKKPSPGRMLQGGDRRSIGNSNRIVTRIMRDPRRLAGLIECLWSDDPVIRMRAADATEKISVRRPELIASFKGELLGLAEEATQAELRWHLALMLPRLPLTPSDRRKAWKRMQVYLDDRSSIVKTCAIQAMAELSRGDAALEAEVLDLLQQAGRTGTPAMKARSGKLLKQLQKP
jgi:hypothetical protein